MKKILSSLMIASAVCATGATAFAGEAMSDSSMHESGAAMHGSAMHGSAMHGKMMMKDPMVGGAAMYPSKNIVENAMQSKDHTTLVAAVKAAGLVKTLEGPGPFTVFAPTNEAFGKLPEGTVSTLLKPENKAKLTKVLTYHVVPGKLDSKALMAKIKSGMGKATLTTVEGEKLVATEPTAGVIEITDSKGGMSKVTTADVYQSNGVIHVVNSVLLP